MAPHGRASYNALQSGRERLRTDAGFRLELARPLPLSPVSVPSPLPDHLIICISLSLSPTDYLPSLYVLSVAPYSPERATTTGRNDAISRTTLTTALICGKLIEMGWPAGCGLQEEHAGVDGEGEMDKREGEREKEM